MPGSETPTTPLLTQPALCLSHAEKECSNKCDAKQLSEHVSPPSPSWLLCTQPGFALQHSYVQALLLSAACGCSGVREVV